MSELQKPAVGMKLEVIWDDKDRAPIPGVVTQRDGSSWIIEWTSPGHGAKWKTSWTTEDFGVRSDLRYLGGPPLPVEGGKLTRQCRCRYEDGSYDDWHRCGFKTPDDCRATDPPSCKSEHRYVDSTGAVVPGPGEAHAIQCPDCTISAMCAKHKPVTSPAVPAATGIVVVNTTKGPRVGIDPAFLPTAKPPLREVFSGGAWLDFDRFLANSDEQWRFEDFKHRRENGIVAAVAVETGVRIVGKYNPNGVSKEPICYIPRSEFQRAPKLPLGLRDDFDNCEDA